MHIAARVPERVALQRLRLGPIRRLRVALRIGRINGPAQLPKLELAWLPRHLFDIRCVLGKDEHTITASVDSHSGMFTISQMDAWIVDGTPPGEMFAPVMPLDAAESAARQGLLTYILRQRGTLAKPEPRDTVRIRLIHYPYWVYYFDAGGYVDIRALDAVTGERGGGKVKRAMLNAFAHSAEGSNSSDQTM